MIRNWRLRLAIFVAITSVAILIAFNGKPLVKSNRIVVKVMRSGFLDLLYVPRYTYIISPIGSGEVRESVPRGLGDEATWSPDGKWIVYSTLDGWGGAEESDIYLSRSDGSQRTRLTDHQSGGSFNPTWSPDGTKIAYFAYDKKGNNDGVYILNVECFLRGERCSPVPIFLIQGRTPDWSPDGQSIVYKPAFVGDGIFVVNADGTGQPVDLTPSTATICHHPKWSPDGEGIVVGCYLPQKETFAIFVVNADGSGAINLTDGAMPSWSPDGSKIVFVSSRGSLGKCIAGICGSSGVYSNALFLMNADGSDIVRLSFRDDESVLWYAWTR